MTGGEILEEKECSGGQEVVWMRLCEGLDHIGSGRHRVRSEGFCSWTPCQQGVCSACGEGIRLHIRSP